MEENVRIVITGDNKDALKKVDQVEKAVNDLNRVSQQVEIGVKGINKVEREVARLYTALEKLESAALSKLPRSVQVVIAYLKAATQSAGELGGRLAFAGVQVDNLSRAKFIPAGLLPAAKEVDNFTDRINLSIEAVRRLGDAMAALYAKALPRAGGSQGFTGFLQQQYPALPPGFGGGFPGLPGIGGSGGGRGGALALRDLPKGQAPSSFTFDPSTLRGLREGVRYFRDLLDETEIGTVKFRKLEEVIAQLNNRISEAQLKGQKSGIGTPVSKGSIAALRQQSEALTAALEQAEIGSKSFRQLERSLRSVNRQIRKTEDSVRGTTGRNKLGAAAIGGAFPLLFGQGPAAAIGGALGEMVGPMGGIVGTAIGSPIDQFVAGAAELGQALNPLTADIEKITQAAGLAGTETELYIQAIEKNAGKQAALKAATEELAAVVGQDGVKALQEFGRATNSLGNAFNQLLAQMSAGLAKAFAGVTEQIAKSLSRANALQAGLGRTDGAIGASAAEFKRLRARQGKVTSAQQLKDNERLRELQNEIVSAVQAENRERLRTLRITKDLQEKIRGIKDQEAQVQTQLQILDITQQASTKSTEAAELRKQATDLVARKEEQIASIRLNLEQQISSIRQQNLSREAQLRNNQDRLELARLRNRLTQASQDFAASINLNEPGRDFAVALNEAAAKFNWALEKGEASRSENFRKTTLDLNRISLKAEQTKASIRRQVSKLEASFQKQSAELTSKVAEYNLKVSQQRFNLERELVRLQLNRLEAETLLLREKLSAEGQLSDKQRTNFERTFDLIEKSRTAVKEQVAPAQIEEGFISSASGGVETSELDTVIGRAENLVIRLSEVQGNIITEQLKSDQIAFTGEIQRQTQALVEQQTPLDERLKIMQQTAEISRLVAEGFSEADASSIVKGAQAFALLKEELVNSKVQLEKLLLDFTAIEDKTPETVSAIKTLQKALGDVNNRLSDVTEQSNTFINTFQKTSKLDEYIKNLNKNLTDTEAQAIRVADGVSNAIGSSLDNAISQLIEGSATVKEVFADMLKSVGQVLVQEGTKMIATYVAIGIARAFAGLTASQAPMPDALPQMTPDAIVTPTGFTGQFAGMAANGGPVKGGRPYLVGERGPELFIPGSNGGVMRNEDMRQLMGRSPVASSAPAMNFTFETTNIGGTEYVSREQLEAAMATTRRQAANDGAKRGMSMTLDKMRTSPRTRSSIGIG